MEKVVRYRKQFEIKELEVKSAGYTDFGWENGWGKFTPAEIIECHILDHTGNNVIFDIQANNSGSKNIRGCNLCKYYTYYDCS